MRNISSKTLITLLIISLTGIIGLQTYLFQNSITVKEDQFDQNALSAMNIISSRLEKMDAMNMMMEEFEFDPLFSKQMPIDSVEDTSDDDPLDKSFLLIPFPSEGSGDESPDDESPNDGTVTLEYE